MANEFPSLPRLVLGHCPIPPHCYFLLFWLHQEIDYSNAQIDTVLEYTGVVSRLGCLRLSYFGRSFQSFSPHQPPGSASEARRSVEPETEFFIPQFCSWELQSGWGASRVWLVNMFGKAVSCASPSATLTGSSVVTRRLMHSEPVFRQLQSHLHTCIIHGTCFEVSSYGQFCFALRLAIRTPCITTWWTATLLEALCTWKTYARLSFSFTPKMNIMRSNPLNISIMWLDIATKWPPALSTDQKLIIGPERCRKYVKRAGGNT